MVCYICNSAFLLLFQTNLSANSYVYFIFLFPFDGNHLNYFPNQNVISFFFFLSHSYIYVIFESSARCPYSCVKRALMPSHLKKAQVASLALYSLTKKEGFQFGSSNSIITTINMNLIQ